MSSSFWLLGDESRDFSQAEKERIACKAEQIHKMTTIFTQKENLQFYSLNKFIQVKRSSDCLKMLCNIFNKLGQFKTMLQIDEILMKFKRAILHT